MAALASFIARRTSAGAEIAALFGAFRLGLPGYAAIAVVAGAIAVLTGVLSRRIVFRQLSAALVNARPFACIRTAMTALRSFAFNVAFYVNLIVLMIVGLPLILFGRHGVFFMARLWSGSSLWLLEKICGLRVEFRGVENIPQGGYILAAKHQSFLETFALLGHAPDFAIIFKRQLAWIPLFGLYLVGARQIAIDRSRGHAALSQIIAQARDVLGAGRQIMIYPEGTRRPPGAPPRYKYGVAAIYAEQQRALRAGRAQHRPLLGPAQLHPPPRRGGDRISAADPARPRPRRLRRAARKRDGGRPARGSTRKRSPPTPASRRCWRRARRRSTDRSRPASARREA